MSKRMLFAIIPLVAAVIAFLAGSYRFTLECDRDAASCTWEQGVLGGEERTFAFTDIQTVRYEGGRGKHGGDGLVAVDLKDGSEIEFAYGDDDEAKAETEVAKQFFAKQGARSYGFAKTWSWAYALAAIFAFGAIMVVVTVAMKPPST